MLLRCLAALREKSRTRQLMAAAASRDDDALRDDPLLP